MAHCFCKRPAELGTYASIGLLLVAMALYAGCRRTTTVTDSEGHKATVTQKGNSVEITSKGKDGQEVRLGEGVALPEDFPKDVAIYPKATVFMSSKEKKGTMSVMLKIANPAQSVATFYQEKLKENGWDIENTTNVGNLTMLQAVKEGRKLAVSVNKDASETMVTLVLEKEN
jgi:hypothetical protein